MPNQPGSNYQNNNFQQIQSDNRKIKIFLFGSIGLLILVFALLVFGAFLLLPKTDKKASKPKATNNINATNNLSLQKTENPNMFVTKAPEQQKTTYPSISFIDPQIGSQNMPITIIEFSDFNCPYCAEVQPILTKLLNKYSDKIRLVWKNLPITQLHPSAEIAAESAMCAGEQNKFWQYHDLLFANQDYFTRDILNDFATQLDLNIENFNNCLDTHKMLPRIEKSTQEANDLSIDGTPYFFINQQKISGSLELEDFERIIEQELNKK